MSASTTLLTDIASAISTGPNATSAAAANAAAGPIQDITGNLKLVQLKLQEAKKLLTEVDTVIDSGDSIQATITNILSSLS